MIKQIVVGALLSLVMATGAMAASCAQINEISGISSMERQRLVVACETTKLNEKKSPFEAPESAVLLPETLTKSLTPDTLEQISTIAKTAGQTVREVAKELNIAANEFVKTPVGMLTAGLAIWYVAGDTISGLAERLWEMVGGVFLILLATHFYLRFLRFTLTSDTETFTEKGWFGSEKQKTRPVYRSWESLSLDGEDGATTILTIVWAGCIIVGFLLIF